MQNLLELRGSRGSQNILRGSKWFLHGSNFLKVGHVFYVGQKFLRGSNYLQWSKCLPG